MDAFTPFHAPPPPHFFFFLGGGVGGVGWGVGGGGVDPPLNGVLLLQNIAK